MSHYTDYLEASLKHPIKWYRTQIEWIC